MAPTSVPAPSSRARRSAISSSVMATWETSTASRPSSWTCSDSEHALLVDPVPQHHQLHAENRHGGRPLVVVVSLVVPLRRGWGTGLRPRCAGSARRGSGPRRSPRSRPPAPASWTDGWRWPAGHRGSPRCPGPAALPRPAPRRRSCGTSACWAPRRCRTPGVGADVLVGGELAGEQPAYRVGVHRSLISCSGFVSRLTVT